MINGSGTIFTEFLEDYYAECDEHLTAARQSLLALESDQNGMRPATVDELLRRFHSLKGLSAMVGVNEITEMAHLVEEYLRELQSIQSAPNAAGIEALITAVEAMEQVISCRRKGEPAPDISGSLKVLHAIAPQDRIETFIPAPANSARHRWQFTFQPSQELATRGINVNSVRDKLQEIGSVIQASPRVSGEGITFEFIVASERAAEEVPPLMLDGMTFLGGEPSHSKAPQKPQPPESPPQTASFVRVEMRRLDELMRLIGELVISRSHLDETLRSIESTSSSPMRPLHEVNGRIERQLRTLREAVMRVRMVPIRQIFERMRFVVRGLERDTQKRVHLTVHGQDTEIDKLIVDRMMDPMLHMVRNAVSHGLETSTERAAAGKPEIGEISISARTAGEKVIIEVQDNGRGVDLVRVAAKARAGGVIADSETVDHSRLLDLICSPGFSTRTDADLTSGRGMGMSVVQSTVRELGGSIAMETAAGKGTKFTVTLPLTLVILDALLVTIADQRYAVPQSSIREIIAIDNADIRSLENNKLIPYRGRTLPLVTVSDLFGLNSRNSRMHVLVIGGDGNAVGLGVDKVTGQREIVVRSISDPQLRIPGIVGATELGDGKPVLIVDAEALVRLRKLKEMNA